MQDQPSSQPSTQLIIRHVAGAKINKIEQFQLDATKEITLGRDTRSTIAYDSPQDDVVSRKHAAIRVKSEEPLTVVIEDLGSSNGTFVNGQRVTGETELAPDDKVALGQNGPEFVFDVQPRPASLASRTRVLSTIETTATRVVAATGKPEAATTAKLPPKVGIGRNTVQLMLSEERKRTSQVWMGGLAAVLAFVLVGGGVLYWHNASTAEKLQQEATEERERIALQTEQIRADTSSAVQQQISTVTQQIGMSPGDIIGKYGNSTVVINFSWRLYDKETGRPIYHKSLPIDGDKTKRRYPAYFKLESGKVIPWLTTDDEGHQNYEVRGAGSGSGFVISEQGFILSNKHVAAGWMVRVPPDKYATNAGALVTAGSRGKINTALVDIMQTSGAEHLRSWVPEDDGGSLFASKIVGNKLPDVKNSSLKTFYGRNETLEVRFPGSRLSINATLVRASTDSDAALIKIESPQALTPLDMASDDVVKIGERVIVLGYPGISDRTFAQFTTNEGGQTRQRVEFIPEPTVTDGIVSRLGTETVQEGNMRITGMLGDAIQLSVVATGSGNSGGPVFNAAGKVVGLFTWGATGRDGTRVSFAVPIKHGRALLQPQRIQ
jgi:S1-C subfamily serine protease/pSer/pThr/pTyr-binding forkhead associated (FHA) protein